MVGGRPFFPFPPPGLGPVVVSFALRRAGSFVFGGDRAREKPGRAAVWPRDQPVVVSYSRKHTRASYLVDPASSYMLVSKIKPCRSKYRPYTAKLRMAH